MAMRTWIWFVACCSIALGSQAAEKKGPKDERNYKDSEITTFPEVVRVYRPPRNDIGQLDHGNKKYKRANRELPESHPYHPLHSGRDFVYPPDSRFHPAPSYPFSGYYHPHSSYPPVAAQPYGWYYVPLTQPLYKPSYWQPPYQDPLTQRFQQVHPPRQPYQNPLWQSSLLMPNAIPPQAATNSICPGSTDAYLGISPEGYPICMPHHP